MPRSGKPSPREVRALRIVQVPDHPLYVFMLRAAEILQLADVSRVSRDEAGDLIGYQRAEVRSHVKEIVDYLDSDIPIFPNPIIFAISPEVQFKSTRGPRMPDDGVVDTGRLCLPAPVDGRPKLAWIVDGQQRALALAHSKRSNFPVPVVAFVAGSVKLQRDQFVRINNTRPLPRSLVNELLPEVDSILPARLAVRKAPAELCDILSTNPSSPFAGLIRRSSDTGRKTAAVVAYNAIISMITDSLNSPSGGLYPYRDVGRQETDYDSVVRALIVYWTAVRDTFPEAWGKPPEKSRLMHGAGILAMGRLMDRILVSVDPLGPDAPKRIRSELALIAPDCRWTGGTWEGLGKEWNEIQNLTRHVRELSSYLIRLHHNVRRATA